MPTKTYRVLVVDDNRDSASSMSVLLTLSGFTVETCFDGPSALAAADRCRPDACLLDINMPGMDGYDLATRLRDRFPDNPPLLATLTAYEDHAHLEHAAAAGYDLQFTKPVDYREVVREFEAHAPAPAADDRSVVHGLLSRLFGAR